MTIDRWLSRLPIDSPSPFMKQVPTVVGFAIAAGIAAVPNGVPVTNAVLFLAGIGLVVVATILAIALPWHRFHAEWTVVVPVLSLLAVGLLRLGTGGAVSPFAVLTLLPFVWIASEEGRVNILIAGLSTFVVLLAPIVFEGGTHTAGDLVRAFFSPEKGEPRVTTRSTSSGCSLATSRAKMPPRLQPISVRRRSGENCRMRPASCSSVSSWAPRLTPIDVPVALNPASPRAR